MPRAAGAQDGPVSRPPLKVVEGGPRSAVVTTRIPAWVREGLKRRAADEGLTMSGLAGQILARAVEGDEADPAPEQALTYDAGF